MGTPTGPLSVPPIAETTDPQIIRQDNMIRAVLAVVVFVGVSIFVNLAAFYKSPMLPGDTLGMVLGILLAWVSAMIAYYFGSSSGSAVKTQQANK